MADKSSWVKINRNITKWRWFKTQNTLHVWLWLILSANIEDHGFQNEVVKRGEIATSYKTIADSTGMTPKMALTAVNHLKQTGEVSVRRGANFIVISILNYDEYQAVGNGVGNSLGIPRELQGNSKGMTKELPCQQSKNIRNKEIKKGKNNSSGDETTTMIPMPPTVADVRAYCAENGITTDAEAFVKFNTVRGWMYGRVKITDWRPLVHQWAAKDNSFADQSNPNYDPHPELDDFGRPIQPKYK